MKTSTSFGLKLPTSALRQNSLGLYWGILMQHCHILNSPPPISLYHLLNLQYSQFLQLTDAVDIWSSQPNTFAS